MEISGSTRIKLLEEPLHISSSLDHRVTHRDSGPSLNPKLLTLLLSSFAQISFLLHLLDLSWLEGRIRKTGLRTSHMDVSMNYCPSWKGPLLPNNNGLHIEFLQSEPPL